MNGTITIELDNLRLKIRDLNRAYRDANKLNNLLYEVNADKDIRQTLVLKLLKQRQPGS